LWTSGTLFIKPPFALTEAARPHGDRPGKIGSPPRAGRSGLGQEWA
jgi:hypothetical protein